MRLFGLLLLILFAGFSSAHADDISHKPGIMTLLDAHQMALQHDATIRAARSDNTVQQEEINKAKAGFLPQARLSLYQGRSDTDSRTPGYFGTTNHSHSAYDSKNYSLSIRQPIFNMASYAQYSQSKSEARRSDAVLDGTINSLISRVSGAYLDMLLSTENIQYLEAQKSSIEGQLRQAEARFKSGYGTVTEISEAEANLASSGAKETEFLNALENAKRAIEGLTGVYPNQFLCLDPDKLSLELPNPRRVEDWIDSGLEKNPDIIADQFAQESAKFEVDKNQSGHYPTLDLVASRTDTESDTNYTIGSKYSTDSVGLQLNVPLYLGGYVNASVRQAAAKLEETRDKSDEHKRDVTANIRKYFNEVVNGVSRINAFIKAVKSTEVALDGTQKGFLAGIRTNVDVLNAQEKLFSAKRDLAKERYLLIYNRVLLKQYSGMLKETDLHEISSIFALSEPNKGAQ